MSNALSPREIQARYARDEQTDREFDEWLASNFNDPAAQQRIEARGPQIAAAAAPARVDRGIQIRNEAELRNAIITATATNEPGLKAHVVVEAKRLGLSRLLPPDWRDAEASAVTSFDLRNPPPRTLGR
jgi:hypothetical protein